MAKKKDNTPLVEKETFSKVEKTKPRKVRDKKLVYIDDFISAIAPICDLSNGQAIGFKAFMQGNQYQEKLDDFIPYLERYIGKDVK